MLALAACSGGGGYGGGIGNGPQACQPGTAVQLAQPLPNQTGVPVTIGQIIIVANGSTNTLHDNPSVWLVTLSDTAGDAPIFGSALNPVPDPNGPHPFPSDFYYASNVTTLNSARNYNVFLGRTDGTCQAIQVGSFST
jgi:hypothetical protein